MKMKKDIMFVAMFLLVCLQVCNMQNSKKKNVKRLKTRRCKYTFVVKEMPENMPDSCPPDVRQFQADVQAQKTAGDVYVENAKFLANPEMKELVKRLKTVEQQLDGELVKNQNLNMTISKQEQSLVKTDKLLQEYRTNFSRMFRLINHMEQNLHHQKSEYRNLEKKVSSIVLDVVEVNNVLAKKVSPLDGNVSLKKKEIQVESVSKILNCGQTNPEANFKDCQEVYARGHTVSGVYYITPMYSSCSIPVWCDMDTPPGGWLVIQNRNIGDISFNRFWQEYKDGFGNVVSEFWLGLDNMFLLSNQDHYELRVDLWDFDDNRVHALYKDFKLDGERDKYKIHVEDFEGSARNGLAKHNGMKFSTPDQDNDNWPNYHCGREWQAGWWFNNCWFAFLNGQYHNTSKVTYRGISWNDWKPQQLAKTQMKIRPSRLHHTFKDVSDKKEKTTNPNPKDGKKKDQKLLK